MTGRFVVDGWPVELADTAGWRTTADGLEQQGQQAAAAATAQAEVCLWLLDGSAPPQWPAETEMPGVHYVITKVDLPAAWDHATVPRAVRLSALTGVGVRESCAALATWLVPEPPAQLLCRTRRNWQRDWRKWKFVVHRETAKRRGDCWTHSEKSEVDNFAGMTILGVEERRPTRFGLE